MNSSPSRARLAAVLLMTAAMGLAGCSSGPDSGSDLTPPETSAEPVYRAPSKTYTRTPTLGRVVDETQRRRQVIRQLDSIFRSSKPEL